MKARRLAAALVLCVFVGVLLCVLVDEAQAQPVTGDKDLAAQKGLEVLEGGKEKDVNKAPTKLQMAMGVGSVFVAVAVLKWL